MSLTDTEVLALAGPRKEPPSGSKQTSPAPQEPAQPEWMDRFKADFMTFTNAYGIVFDAYSAALTKLQKALEDDAKYGMDTQSWFSGTRKKAQINLDEMHRLLRAFIAKWGDMPSNDIIETVKTTERRLEIKVP